MRFATDLLERAPVPFFVDAAGNIVVGAASQRDYLARLRTPSSRPLRLFVAHMDHPGFHGQRWVAEDRLAVRWYGGSPVRHLRGARVRIATDAGIEGTGRIVYAEVSPHGRSIARAEIRVDPGFARGRRRPGARTLFGGFDFGPPVREARGRIFCPAADDLVGVFAILETARDLAGGRSGGSDGFLGLLTRGEEVGFVGAIAHLELGLIQQRRRPLVGVSLEASRTLEGAAIGRGPVLRLGDRRTVFDPDGLRVLEAAAAAALPGAHQRRIMDGGACEATALTAWGVPAIGISVPLGNYHNQGFEGGWGCRAPHGPAPEFVDRSDVDGLLRLCRALARNDLPWDDPWASNRAAMLKNLVAHRRLLRRQAGR